MSERLDLDLLSVEFEADGSLRVIWGCDSADGKMPPTDWRALYEFLRMKVLEGEVNEQARKEGLD